MAGASLSDRHFRGGRVFVCALMMLAAAIFPPVSARADTGLISADAALSAVISGEAAMIDVRSPQEWRQTGVAKGATPITLHGPRGLDGLIAAVEAEFGEDRSRPLVIVCARGNRSTYVQSALRSRGFSQVLNMREGMLGSTDGPGWLARKLPLQPPP